MSEREVLRDLLAKNGDSAMVMASRKSLAGVLDALERAEAERDQARAEVERLREALAGIVDEENTVSHAHLRPGIWDDDNVPALAGKPCERCAAFARARAALGSSGEVGTEQETR